MLLYSLLKKKKNVCLVSKLSFKLNDNFTESEFTVQSNDSISSVYLALNYLELRYFKDVSI